MTGMALRFFVSAVFFLLGGMGLGIFIGIIHDHTLAAVHAHINLVGFLIFVLMGLYYRTRRRRPIDFAGSPALTRRRVSL